MKVAARVSLLQVFRLSSRQLYSLIHGHVRVLRHSNNGPVAGGLTQTQNLDISKHLSYLYIRKLSWIVCKGRYGDLCAYCVIDTPYTRGHNAGRNIAVFQDSEDLPTCPSAKYSIQVECTEVEQ